MSQQESNKNKIRYRTATKQALASAYGVSRWTFKDILKPFFAKIVENNQKAFFNVKAEDYNSIRTFLPSQTRAIHEHLGECEHPEHIIV